MRRRLAHLAVPAALAATMAATAAPVSAHPGHGRATVQPAQAMLLGSNGNGWRANAPIAGGPRQEHSVTTLGGDVYVLGGIVPNAAAGGPPITTTRVEVYDAQRDRWTDAAPLPIPMNHPNVATVGGRIYVLGGLSGGESWRALPDAFVYSPTRDRWTRLPNLPMGMERGSAAVGVRGSRIHLAGGMRTLTPRPGGLQDTVATVSSYDVETGRWRTLPDLPEARDHVGGALIGNTFYVIGGRDRGQVNVRDTVYAMNLRTRRWTERAPMPTPRGGLATATVGSKVYTFGGEGNQAEGSNGVFTETEVYNARTDRWRQLPAMPVPRHGTAATTVGRTIYVPGGGTAIGGSAIVDTNDAYRPR